MSETWTSDPHDPDEAFRRISAWFVIRRGRGTALSAADIDALESWIRAGHSWFDVLHAVDTAFAKLRNPPASLRACARFLPAKHSGNDLLDASILADVFGGSVSTAASAAVEKPEESSALSDAVERLQSALNAAQDPRASACYRALLQELDELALEGEVSVDTLLLLDEALALLGLEALDPAAQHVVREAVERSALVDRTRTLLQRVGEYLDLDYPNLGRVHATVRRDPS